MHFRAPYRARQHASRWGGRALTLVLWVAALLAGCGTPNLPAPATGETAAATPDAVAMRPAAPAYWPTHGWKTATPEQQGLDSAMLLRALEHIDDSNINVRSLTVIRNGYIVLEVFRQPFAPAAPYPVFSVTKSVTGALVGIAIHEGALPSVTSQVLGSFPALTSADQHADKAAITLEDLLTMQPGLDCADRDIGYAIEASSNWVQAILDLPMAGPPGRTFAYCTAGPHLLSAILSDATGMSTAAYAQSRLFGPLGIAPGNVGWDADPQGVTIGGYGLRLQTRDMAKLGLLYLYHGTWDGTQVVPESWMTASTTVHATERPGKSYGYLLWLYPDDPYPYVAAEGLGSQVVQVVQDRNLVVVMTAALADPYGQTTRDLLQSYILPAASSAAPLPDNPAALAAMQAKVADLANPVRPVATLSDTAKRITGKPFVMEGQNALDVREFTLTFAEHQADMLIQAVSTEGATAQITVGLDNVYRQTPGDPVWRRGWWDDEHTFVLREVDTGSIQEREIRVTFVEDEVRVHGAETTLGSFAVDMQGVMKEQGAEEQPVATPDS